ncbi:MAG TPA: TonB-dependent receptor [Steroidobacteraceae bacterium]|nr:TonB-dependent receptor [Steroidobacteraceae bacterium]
MAHQYRFLATTAGSAVFTLMLLAVGAPAHAEQQDSAAASDESIETVEVTGIRHAIQDAITTKKDSGSIVEAISAEDIGKLPDTSIAESISRLPGLTSQRAEGRASAISLRGTDPGFTTALLNGREQVSTGDNRNIEFDQYPSELLSQVVVYKTPDARLVGQGLAGTIDLRTTRPLTYGKRALVFNIRGERNSQDNLGADADADGYRVSFSYIDQFADGKFGLTFGVARLESPLATEGAGTYEPWHTNGTPNAGDLNPTGIVNPGVGAGVFITDGIKVRTDMGKNRRDGAMAAFEFRPNDSYHSVLDLYYTQRKQTDNARSLEVNLGGYPGPCCDGAFPDNTVFGYSQPIILNTTVVSGTLNQRVPLARNFLFKTEDKILAAGWNNKFDMGEWNFAADLSYSKATRDEDQFETNAQYVPDTRASCAAPGDAGCHPVVADPRVPDPDPLNPYVDTPRQVYDTGYFQLTHSGMPQLSFSNDYGDPALVQVGPTIYGAGYSKIPHVTDELKSARIDAGRTLGGWFSDFSFGANYSDRTKDKNQPEGNLSTIGNGYFQVAGDSLLPPTDLSYAGAGSALAWNVPAVLAAYYNPIIYGTPTTPGFDYLIGKNWSVDEKVTTGYLNANLDHEISSSVALKGNVGVQVVWTDQSSTAFQKNNVTGTVDPFTDGKKYSDVLPTINLAFILPEQQAVRVGIAREIARARMDQLKASSEVGAGFNGATGAVVPGGSGGNPQLDPWRADAFDLSYEKYFADNKGYVSLAAFYKKLKTYIYNTTDATHDFSDFVATLPPCYLGTPPNCPPISTTGNYTSPLNGNGGNLKGLELSLSLPGEAFSDSLAGFGTILSISQTDSGIKIQDPPGNNFLTGNGLGTIPLPGLSKTVWNATFYYETEGFSARIATRSRSKYIGEVTNFANDRSFKFVKGDEITDLQLGYAFGDGRMSGLSVLFQVNNMFNEPYIAYARTETRQQDFQQYGRQFLLGINYKL